MIFVTTFVVAFSSVVRVRPRKLEADRILMMTREMVTLQKKWVERELLRESQLHPFERPERDNCLPATHTLL